MQNFKYVNQYKKSGKKSHVDSFVLLSNSPRRKELLAFLNPSIQSVEIDERAIEDHFMKVYEKDSFIEKAAKTCCEISMGKSDMDLEEGKMYISSDTIVIHNDQIYNKPQSKDEARDMFLSYFGKKHYVVTSVCLRMKDYLDVFYTIAQVEFVEYYDQLEKEIHDYLESGSPMDKAGAYGIQELDPRFVKSIEGDIHTIIGLPVAEVSRRIFDETA